MGRGPVIGVMATYRRPELARRCVESLRSHVEDVIVVDGVSPVARARNEGIARAPENAIIFSVDDDCFYDERLRLHDSVQLLDESVGVIQVAHRPLGEPWTEYRAIQDRTPPTFRPCIFAWMAGGFLFRRAAWAEVGGYPDEFLDDVAFCMQLYRAGFVNAHSTYSYGYHENNHPLGGLAQAEVYSPSNPSRFGLLGRPWTSRGGVKTIRPTAVEPAVMHEHEQRRRQRFAPSAALVTAR